ncbi:unnamed protein product, partial [Polarella glacialis]
AVLYKLPQCGCPDDCYEREGYYKILPDASTPNSTTPEPAHDDHDDRRLYHESLQIVNQGQWLCAPGYTGRAEVRCARPGECIDESELAGCFKLEHCDVPALDRFGPGAGEILLLAPPPGSPSAEERAVAAAQNPLAVVPWVEGAEQMAPQACRLAGFDCFRLFQNESCKANCQKPFLPGPGPPAAASCPKGNLRWMEPAHMGPTSCALGDCYDPNPLTIGHEKTSEGYRCSSGFAGEVQLKCLPNSQEEGCGARPYPSGCKMMVPCIAPKVDLCKYDVSDCKSVANGASCTVRCQDPFQPLTSRLSLSVGRCPLDNTDPIKQLEWEPHVCTSSECPVPATLPMGYATNYDGEFVCDQGYEGQVETLCSHNYTMSCAPNALSFFGCSPRANCKSCPVPEIAPNGYVKTSDDGWACAEGYNGKVSIRCKTCVSPLELGGCAPLVECLPPEVDSCVFDARTCWDLKPGGSCQVLVRYPYAGNTTTARCLPNNTDPGKRSTWKEPPVTCLDPELPPTGYAKNATSWYCAEGFRGTVSKRCEIARDQCLVEAEMLGCVPLQPCVPMSLPDPCMINDEGCESVMAGARCKLTCKAPYVSGRLEPEPADLGYDELGSPIKQVITEAMRLAMPVVLYANASCDPDNVDPARPTAGTLPPCATVCPDPIPIPPGHVKVGGVWRCTEGYGGKASIVCNRKGAGSCDWNVTLSGCNPLMGCSPPVVETCSMEASACTGLFAGESCRVMCVSPWQMANASGYPEVDMEVPAGSSSKVGRMVPYAVGSCPADNSKQNPPNWITDEPVCDLVCPLPQVVPDGYVRQGLENKWKCGRGYAGDASVTCTVDDNCNVPSVLIGCHPLMPCATPEYDRCQYDMNEGNCIGLGPGQSCWATCKHPYSGDNMSASCPATNIDPSKPFDWNLENCSLSCVEPSDPPEGYIKDAYGIVWYLPQTKTWRCANGYVGQVIQTCDIGPNCEAVIAMSGCLKIVPCLLPPGLDACVLNLTNCTNLMSNHSCSLSCRHPFVGAATVASCPLYNTDPSRIMTWSEPTCECLGPPPLPTGYGFRENETGLFCSPGHAGVVDVNCSVGDICLDEASIAGCMKTIPCEVGYFDPCVVNSSDCSSVEPGASCELMCLEPFLGNSSVASCSIDNLLPSGLEVTLAEPGSQRVAGLCSCPDPDPRPSGYVKDGLDWTCSVGYIGVAVVQCTPTPGNCSVETVLSGCVELMPCKPLSDTCQYNTSDCSLVMSGESCLTSCKDPYIGSPSRAMCPEGNVDANTPLVWTPPICNFTICPEPQLSAHLPYTATDDGWRCASGYGGTAIERCPLTETCTTETFLDGCKPIVGCVTPSLDACVYDADSCKNMASGQICALKCRTPWQGANTAGICIPFNTNPDRLVSWLKPTCKLACPAPDPMPDGYVWNYTSGRPRCKEGFTGIAQSNCYRGGGECVVYSFVSGCTKLEPCVAPDIDACAYDYDSCDHIMGGMECKIHCRPPYQGVSTSGNCLFANTIPGMPWFWAAENCYCPDPCPVPPGYFKTEPGYGNWVCAEGYVGKAELRCSADRVGDTGLALETGLQKAGDGGCFDKPRLGGCHLKVPCAPLTLGRESCDADVAGCEMLAPGATCEVRCRHPYEGNGTTATCPAENTDPDFQPEMAENLTCSVMQCKDKDYVPEGYVKAFDGWRCDEGWGGTPALHCSLGFENATDGSSGCDVSIAPTGCLPQKPCLPPDLPSCEYDVSDCVDVQPGSDCKVQCRQPFLNAFSFVVAHCPEGNLDRLYIADLPELPQCLCPDPPTTPLGYVQSEGNWICAEGFAKDALKRCQISPDSCLEEPELIGCAPLMPCVHPPDVDYCKYDLTRCDGVMPAGTCQISCVPPYQLGQVQLGSCLANNTDPTMPFDWNPVECVLTWEDCTDPLPLPAGYEKAFEGWRCAPGEGVLGLGWGQGAQRTERSLGQVGGRSEEGEVSGSRG